MTHLLEKFKFCPACGSPHFVVNDEKSKRCENCDFVYFMNPSAANVAFILNEHGELLVERRRNDPGKGTLDLPGGFSDANETGEEGIIREVREETNLQVDRAEYVFSLPNEYRYSGLDIPTLDMFFRCEVSDTSCLKAGDDAGEVSWLPLEEVRTEQFGLRSIRQGLRVFLERAGEMGWTNTGKRTSESDRRNKTT